MKKFLSLALCSVMVFSSVGIQNVFAAEPTLKILAEPSWDETADFYEGTMKVVENGKVGYVDSQGNYIIEPTYDISQYEMGDFHEGLASVYEPNIEGPHGGYYINTSNEKALDTSGIYNDNGSVIPTYFKDGLAVNRIDPTDMIGIYTKDGSLVDRGENYPPFSFIQYSFGDGLVGFQSHENEKWGYLDQNQNTVIEPKFDEIRPFEQGIAMARTGDKWGMINTEGEYIIEPQFEDFMVDDIDYEYIIFNEDIAVVKKDGKWGAIDKAGNTVIDFAWDDAGIVNEGMLNVSKDGKWGYVDKNGNIMVEPQYDDTNAFYNGVVLVGKDGTYSLIDKAGNQVSDETWNFDATRYNSTDDGLIRYSKDGKWGLAQIVSDGTNTTTTSVTPVKSDIKVVFKGEELAFDMPIINKDGRTYYPFRQLLEAVGAEVDWDDATKTAMGTLGENKVEFTIDSNSYKVNGETMSMGEGEMAFIENGSTYIPVRYAAEGLGFTVTWDDATNTINIQ